MSALARIVDGEHARIRQTVTATRRRQMQPKMKCPNADCDGYTSYVVRCRISRDGSVMRRRRQCDTCGARFNTTERVDNSLDR